MGIGKLFIGIFVIGLLFSSLISAQEQDIEFTATSFKEISPIEAFFRNLFSLNQLFSVSPTGNYEQGARARIDISQHTFNAICEQIGAEAQIKVTKPSGASLIRTTFLGPFSGNRLLAGFVVFDILDRDEIGTWNVEGFIKCLDNGAPVSQVETNQFVVRERTPDAFCGDATCGSDEICWTGSGGRNTAPNCRRDCGECFPHTPVCGDGILEGQEFCDDGNIRNGDGCSSTCFIEERLPEGDRPRTPEDEPGVQLSSAISSDRLAIATTSELRDSACSTTFDCAQGTCVSKGQIESALGERSPFVIPGLTENFIFTYLFELGETALERLIGNFETENIEGVCVTNFDTGIVQALGNRVTLFEDEIRDATETDIERALCSTRLDCPDVGDEDYRVVCKQNEEINRIVAQKTTLDIRDLGERIGGFFTGNNVARGLCIAEQRDGDCPDFVKQIGFIDFSDNDCTNGYIVLIGGIIILFMLFSVLGRK